MTDVSLLTAGLAGVASFLLPCVLPLVPGYLSYVSGISLKTLCSETRAAERRAARLTMAAVQETVGHSMALLAVYALGLGVSFLVAVLGVNTFLGFTARFQQYVRAVELLNGGVLIAVGCLVFTNQLAWVSGRLDFLNGFVL